MVDGHETNTDPTELELKIIKQVEYYFGDINLRKDKFLNGKIKENDGWVTLDTLITFNRLKALTSDIEVIANALKKSPNHLLEVNDDNDKVRRCADRPVPVDDEQQREEIISRSVYVKGFSDTATLDEVMDFFKEISFEVEHIRMLYREKKSFKGAVFAVFKTLEKAKEFLSKEDLKYKDVELHVETKAGYQARKLVEWNSKKEEKKKLQKEKEETERAAKIESMEGIEKGCVLHLTDLPNDLRRENLKDLFEQHGVVAWVDFNRGDKEGWIRFKEPNQAVNLENKIKTEDLKLTINEANLNIRVIEGEEEIEYWKKVFASKRERKTRKQKGKKGSRGGKVNFRGIKREKDEECTESTAKKVKEEP